MQIEAKQKGALRAAVDRAASTCTNIVADDIVSAVPDHCNKCAPTRCVRHTDRSLPVVLPSSAGSLCWVIGGGGGYGDRDRLRSRSRSRDRRRSRSRDRDRR
jgi:hypothetical protein